MVGRQGIPGMFFWSAGQAPGPVPLLWAVLWSRSHTPRVSQGLLHAALHVVTGSQQVTPAVSHNDDQAGFQPRT